MSMATLTMPHDRQFCQHALLSLKCSITRCTFLQYRPNLICELLLILTNATNSMPNINILPFLTWRKTTEGATFLPNWEEYPQVVLGFRCPVFRLDRGFSIWDEKTRNNVQSLRMTSLAVNEFIFVLPYRQSGRHQMSSGIATKPNEQISLHHAIAIKFISIQQPLSRRNSSLKEKAMRVRLAPDRSTDRVKILNF